MNDENNGLLRVLMPLTERINKIALRLGIRINVIAPDDLRALDARTDTKEKTKKVNCYVIALILGVLILAVLFCAASIFAAKSNIEGGAINRPQSGKGTKEIVLEVEAERNEEQIFDSFEEYSFKVNEVRLYGEELEKLFQKGKEYIDSTICGENASLDEVTKALVLVTSIPGTSVKVDWNRMDPEFINRDGTINNAELETPVITVLQACMRYFDEERIYEFPVKILPAEKSAYSEAMDAIASALEQADKESETDGKLILPTESGKYSFSWRKHQDTTPWMILVGGLLVSVMVIPLYRMDTGKKLKERAEQIEEDYSQFVSRFVLLLTAGMTVRGALVRLADEYNNSLSEGKQGRRYLYEELVVAVNELALGVSEGEVYEHFGRACGVLCCRRFGNLVSGGVKRGSRAVIENLEKESREAMAERLLKAKEQGEKIGTRLLIPMVGLLGVVIAIIVVPAFKSF